MPVIDVNGESLHYVREGSGDPLVFVHSLGTAVWLWEEQIRRFSSEYEVLAFDARGHGGSTNNGGVTLRDIASDIHLALSQLGIPSAHFVGISMGGLILSHLAGMHPEAVRSLVIADSFATMGPQGAERAEALAQQISASTMAEYGRRYAQETLLPSTPEAIHRALAEGMAAMKMDDYLQTVRSIFTSEVREQMRSFGVPTLVICGEKDNRTPLAKSEEIAGLVPGARLQVIPDAAHLANLDNPSAFNDALDGFLKAQAR